MISAEIAHKTFHEEIYKLPGKVIVLLPDAWNTLSPSEVDLLRKILASVKLTIQGVQIITSNNCSTKGLLALAPSCILAFGVRVREAPKSYEVSEVDGLTILQADRLEQLDDSNKKRLWAALQQVFKVP